MLNASRCVSEDDLVGEGDLNRNSRTEIVAVCRKFHNTKVV